MNVEAEDFWRRAREALRVARNDLAVSADACAVWAYYAAFYAVSAVFALDRRTFNRHSAVEAAVHRDLIKEEGWSEDVGATYNRLNELRHIGHYGGMTHVTPEEAEQAIEMAEMIVRAVADAHPQEFAFEQDDA